MERFRWLGRQWSITSLLVLLTWLTVQKTSAMQSGTQSPKCTTSELPTASELDEQVYRHMLAEWPRLWLAVFHHRTTRGGVCDFVSRSWLIDIYRDKSHAIVIKKASQIGISDFLLCAMFDHARRGQAGLYVLPTDKIVYEFTPRRIDRLIERVPFYGDHCKQLAKHSDTKSQKTIFGVDWNIVGSNVITNFYEKPVDVIIIDELNKCNLENLAYAKDRVGAAVEEWSYKVSNPTFSGVGIDAEYEASDKRQWFVRCLHCNEQQTLDWFVNVVRQEESGSWTPKSLVSCGSPESDGEIGVVCRHCEKPLNRLTDGEWVAEFPDRKISGYQVNKVFADGRSGPRMRELFDEFLMAMTNPTLKQRFYNNVLGVCYDAEGSRISDVMLEQCMADYSMPVSGEGTIAGVDVGGRLHLHVSKLEDGVRRKIFVGTVRDFDELSFKCKQYGVVRGVMDAMPETHAAKQFAFAHPGWLMCSYYPSDKVIDLKIDYANRTVSVDRTQSLDASFADYAEKRVHLPREWRSLDNGDFVKQMKAPTRVFDEDRQRYVWDEGSLADHHRHADNYESIAARIGGSMGSALTLA